MNCNITVIHDNNIIVDNNLSGTLFNVDANLKSFTILSEKFDCNRIRNHVKSFESFICYFIFIF